MQQPLAERMRPEHLDSYIGQKHIVGEGAVLQKAIQRGKLPSMIFWGPPGVGKTTLAKLISKQLNTPFYALSAINSGVKDVRETIASARKSKFFDSARPILFIDEIHRFSKSQQDSLLGAVEQGIVTLIGATTENPSFEVISALLSRCQVYILKALEKDDLLLMLDQAIKNDIYLKEKEINIVEDKALLRYSGGDGRKLLNTLEIVVNNVEGDHVDITNELVTSLIQANFSKYDKGGEQHYDIASALIKSIRGSDPNAAVYYLARMLEGGEDIKFICRRMMISASEDIGLANPNALLLANATMNMINAIGMPEARILLSQLAVYLATSPKSNASYMAINKAIAEVRESGDLPIPLSIRNAPTKLMKDIGYGADYQYAHDHKGNFVAMEFLPEEIKGQVYYEPGDNPSENRIRERLKKWWKKYRY
ncbi:MAG: replication-associated recombination protein A [Bacteroidota bacterium]